MDKSLLKTLQTPCIVVDMQKAENNIMEMQKAADRACVNLRPHIKTHKMVLFAKKQIEAGAKGITCAKLSEAEIMANGGICDIFIAYPLIGEQKLKRAAELAKKVKRLILAVDSLQGAKALNENALEHKIIYEVRLEVDTGAKRTGVQTNIAELAQQISMLKGLKLTGIFTFKSLVYNRMPTTDLNKAAVEEGELMQKIAEECKKVGLDNLEISAGSSPTGVAVANTGKVSEIRPGTYIFNDYMLNCEGAAKIEDIAVRIYATVVSVPCKEYAVIDGGTKTFPMDITPNTSPYNYPGYAIIVGNDDLVLERMNEEHGILVSKKGEVTLEVGDIIELMPIHVCTALNMQNQVYILENGKLSEQKVDARGALT